jgi:RNase P subunit RPR2
LRIKCSCNGSALDVNITNDGKIRLSVPCLFCKQNHSFVVSQSIFFGKDRFLLNCPYSNMDIAFIGDKEKIDAELTRSAEELARLLQNLEAESIKDMQPIDLDEDEVLPDPAIYDSIRFLIKELEAEGKIDCPCHSGEYDIRFSRDGVEVFCPRCGAVHNFPAASPSAAEEYLSVDSLTLHEP